MGRRVFYSFNHRADLERAEQVIKMSPNYAPQEFLSPGDWERLRARGGDAIERWIAQNMEGSEVVVVLIGADTAIRPWVQYEIHKAWSERRGLVGIRIHGLADVAGRTDTVGDDPFQRVFLADGSTVAEHVPVFDPAGSSTREVHDDIASNLEAWTAAAYRRP